MKLLNIGSTPDGPSTKASSVSPVKPIGSGFSSPTRQPSLKDGPVFSTDTDPNIAETRFVRFGKIPAEWFEQGTLHEVLEEVSLPFLSSVFRLFTDLLSDRLDQCVRTLCYRW